MRMPKLFLQSGLRVRLAATAGLVFVLVATACVDMASAIRAHLNADIASTAALQDAARRLRDHLETGRQADLGRAGAALAAPLGAVAVRQALDAGAVDTDALRQGLLQARVPEQDIGSVLRLYRVMRGTEALAGTVALRNDADEATLTLDRIVHQLKARDTESGPFTDRERRTWSRRIDAALPEGGAGALAFSERLDQPVRWLRRTFAAASALFVAALLTLLLLPSRPRRAVARSRWERAAAAGRVGLFEWDMRHDAFAFDPHSLALHGWSGDASGGVATRDVQQVVHPDDHARVRESAAHARVTRQPWVERFRVIRPDGKVRHVEVSGRMDLGETGQDVRMVGAIRPASASEPVSEIADTTAPSRCEVLARVSHELRTPLHAVLGFARLIANDQSERLPATQAHRVDQVLRSGARLLRLVDDVLGIPPSDGPVASVDDLPPPRGRVLYIEDNPVNVLLVKELLARWPEVQLLTADDGETGLMMARTDAPDLVLLDMQLPGMAGLDVLRALRSGAEAAVPPVVVLSANALSLQRDEAVSAGASGYLTKPFAFDQFLEQVRRHLR